MSSAVIAERLHKALDKATRLIEQHERAKREPIAIIGMSCRLPGGADSPAALWQMLVERRDGLCEVPANRWSLERFYSPGTKTPGKTYTKYGGFVGGIDQFDPEFFGLSQREAERMDPQQRLLLELVWNALENAGEIPGELKGKAVGVFVGLCYHDYADIQVMRGTAMEIDVHTGTGVAASIASGRISHFLGVHGPSLTVDTACSSSLLAIHLACQSLRAGECDMAIVGGAQLMLSPLSSIGLCRIGALGSDRSCRTFDRDANGMVRGEGAGVVVLKRNTDALRDANPIHARIRGTATNHDGESSGLTVPNGSAQAKVIQSAHLQGNTALCDIVYLEAHGTGTPLGDPIEVRGIAQAFAGVDCGNPIYLGSVKSSIGHLEAASGIASLIKTVEVLKRGQVPPQAHFANLNPLLELPKSPLLLVPTALEPLPRRPKTVLAGVSSFGFSGANVHVVLEQIAAQPLEREDNQRPLLLAVSARSNDALIQAARDTLRCIGQHDPESARGICAWSLVRRTHFAYRIAIAARDKSQLTERLQAVINAEYSSKDIFYARCQSIRPNVAFHFTGASPLEQSDLGCLRGLSERGAAVIDECEDIFKKEATQILGPHVQAPAKYAILAYIQQCALFEIWREWEISAALLTSESTGRFAAGWAAGDHSLGAGLRSLMASFAADQVQNDAQSSSCIATVNERSRSPQNCSSSVLEVQLGIASAQQPAQESIAGYLTTEGAISLYRAAARLFSVGWVPMCNRSDWSENRSRPLDTPGFTFERRRCWLPQSALYSLCDETPTFRSVADRFVHDIKAGSLLDPIALRQLESLLSKLKSRRDSPQGTYEIHWQRTAPCAPSSTKRPPQVWLLFADERESCELAKSLRESGDSVHIARCGSDFAVDGNDITFRTDVLADYSAAIECASRQSANLRVVYIASSATSTAPFSFEDAEGKCRRLFFVYQALLHSAAGTASLWCVTTNAIQSVAANSNAHCASLHLAPLLGMARAMAVDAPSIWGGLLDHDGSGDLVTELRNEIESECEDVVAYRGGVRYVSRLIPSGREWTLNAVACSATQCYLVTGGTGAIGARFVRWLVERGARRIVLMSRNESRGAFVEQMAKLRVSGVEVLHLKGDVGVKADVQSVLDAILVRNWSLGGIIHTAGVAGYQSSASLRWAQFSEVLRPKMHGAAVLHEATLNLSLEFFVMISSIASIWGSQNQIHYAAANSFLDQLAYYRQSIGLPATTVNLGPWGEGGMTPTDGLRQLKQIGIAAVRADDLFQNIDGFLRSRAPQVIVANMDWPVFTKIMNARRYRPLLSGFSEVATARQGEKAGTSADRGDLDGIEEIVRTTLAEVMNSPNSDFSAEKTFFELGLDSIMAVEFKDALSQKFGITLTATLVFDFPTIPDVAKHIVVTAGRRVARNGAAEPDAAPDSEAGRLEEEIARLEQAL